MNERYTVFNTKNSRDHTLPMTDNTKLIFERRISQGNKYVFQSNDRKLKPITASKTFKRVSEEIGFTFTAVPSPDWVLTIGVGLVFSYIDFTKIN